MTLNNDQIEFSLEQKKIFDTILEHLGGSGPIIAMLGAKHFTWDHNQTTRFHFKGTRKANIVQIRLNENDLYDVSFFRYSPKRGEAKRVAFFEDIYAEDLKSTFEDYTGLLLSL